MAVDTRNKRFSLLGFGQGHHVPYVVPNPDGAIDDVDRPQWLSLYHGSGITIITGQPTINRWGGVPHVRVGRIFAGRTW